MTQSDNQTMFQSLEVPEGHVTCIVPWNGRDSLARFSQVYDSRAEVMNPNSSSIVSTVQELVQLLEPQHGDPLIVRYDRGGTAYLDHNDDYLVVILPIEQVYVLRSSIDIRQAYEAAVHERNVWKSAGVNAAAASKFDELLSCAIQN